MGHCQGDKSARFQGGRLGNLRWAGGGSGSASLINGVPAQQVTRSDHTEGRVGSNGIFRGLPGPGTALGDRLDTKVETRQRSGQNQEESHYPHCSGTCHANAGQAFGQSGHFDSDKQNSSETPCRSPWLTVESQCFLRMDC